MKCWKIVGFLSLIFCPLAGWSVGVPVDGFAASVNGHIITVSDVLKLVGARTPEGLEGAELERAMQQLFDDGLEILIDQRMILAEFEDLGGVVPSQMVDERVNDIIHSRFEDNRAAFQDALLKDGLTLAQWRAQLKEQIILRNTRMENVTRKIGVSPREIRARYLAMQDSLRLDKKVDLAVIILNKEIDDTLSDKETEARAIQRLVTEGGDFEALAKEHSQGFKAEEGGKMGWVEFSGLRPEVKAVLANMKEGQVIEVLPVDEAWWIIKLLGTQEASVQGLNDVQEDIEKELSGEKEERLYKDWMLRLRNKYPITKY